MLIPCDEVDILNTFRVMIILRLLLLLTNLHLKLLSTQGTGADKLLSTQRVKYFSKTVVLFILTKIIKQSFIERYLRQYMNSMTIDRIELILTNMHEYANI